MPCMAVCGATRSLGRRRPATAAAVRNTWARSTLVTITAAHHGARRTAAVGRYAADAARSELLPAAGRPTGRRRPRHRSRRAGGRRPLPRRRRRRVISRVMSRVIGAVRSGAGGRCRLELCPVLGLGHESLRGALPAIARYATRHLLASDWTDASYLLASDWTDTSCTPCTSAPRTPCTPRG